MGKTWIYDKGSACRLLNKLLNNKYDVETHRNSEKSNNHEDMLKLHGYFKEALNFMALTVNAFFWLQIQAFRGSQDEQWQSRL